MSSHDPLVHISVKSSNIKVGGIPVSTTESTTCSTSCPFYGAGCYAKNGPMLWHWKKVDNKKYKNLTDWSGLCDFISTLKAGSPMRLQQAGDLPNLNENIVKDKIDQLIKVAADKNVWTYSHLPRNKHNYSILKNANKANGLTINSSCETLQQVDEVIDQGIPAALVIPSNHPSVLTLTDGKHYALKEPIKTAKGRVGVLCPSQRFENAQCKTCLLCSDQLQTKNRFVIFIAHGTQAKKVNSILDELS
jgi:hypothetical protein